MSHSMGVSRPMPWAVFLGISLALILLGPGSAIAESDGSGSDRTSGSTWTGSESYQRSDDQAWKTQAFTGFEYQGKTDLDRGGDFKYWMISGGVSSGRMVGDHFKFALKGDYRAIGYDFNVNPSPPVPSGLDPWDTVHVLRLNPLLTYLINDRWSVLGGPIVEFSGEESANFGDSLRGGGLFGFGYTRDKLYLAFGVLAMTEIEKDARIQPFVLINWKITNGLTLGLKADNSRGGEFRLGYAFTDNFELGFGIGVRRELFRLNGDGPGIRRDGVGEESSTVAKITAVYQINKKLAIEGYGGVTVDGEFRLENKTGKKIAQADYDDAGFGGMKLRFSF